MKKKWISILMVALMACMLGMTTAYAEDTASAPQMGQEGPGGPRGGGRPMDGDMGTPPERPEGEEGDRTPPALPEDFDGTLPELPEGMAEGGMGRGFGGRGAERPEGEPPVMFDIDATQAAIAAVSDEAAQAKLTELLSAYQAAMETERASLDAGAQPDETARQSAMEAMEAARTALEEALTALGIDISALAQMMPDMDPQASAANVQRQLLSSN